LRNLPHGRALRLTPRRSNLHIDMQRGMLVGLNTEASTSLHVFGGGGPRTVAQVSAEVDFLFEHVADLKGIEEAGGKFDVKSFILERKSMDFIGRGNSSGPDQDGTVNTPAEGFMGYGGRLTQFMVENKGALLKDYATNNPTGYSMLRRAFEGAEAPAAGVVPTAGRPALSRKDWGKENMNIFFDKLSQAAKNFSFYKVDILSKAAMEEIDLSDPNKPRVTVTGDGQVLGTVDANVLRGNTGTSLSESTAMIRDPAARPYCYIGTMSGEKVTQHLNKLGLLEWSSNTSGELVPSKKTDAVIVVGGTSLSASDTVNALHPTMHLFDNSEGALLGSTVTLSARQRYSQNPMGFASRQAIFPNPRHATAENPVAWRQETEPLGTSRELHAAFVHGNGEEVFTNWADIEEANVALAMRATPKMMRDKERLSVLQKLSAQNQRNQHFVEKLEEAKSLQGDARQQKIGEATQTDEGAWRQNALPTILGIAATRDVGEEFARMGADFPHSFGGYGGYPIHRAQLAAITEMKDGHAQENSELLRSYNARMAHVTSSPVDVQQQWYQMFSSGVAVHLQADYTQIKHTPNGAKPLQLVTADGEVFAFDAFITSPTFNPEAEPSIMSLAGQVRPIHPDIPYIAELSLNRRAQTTEGTPSNFEDYGLGGKGAYVPGSKNLAHAQAWDTNNRESAVQVAEGLAYRRFAIEVLAAAGVEDPVERVNSKYAKYLPSETDFATEVRGLDRDHSSVQVKGAFARAVKAAVPDAPRQYSTLIQLMRNSSPDQLVSALRKPLESLATPATSSPTAPRGLSRTKEGRKLEGAHAITDPKHFIEPSAKFEEEIGSIGSFEPASRDSYFGRFVDAKLEVQKAIYQECLQEAMGILRSR
jgi:hypothetical protein